MAKNELVEIEMLTSCAGTTFSYRKGSVVKCSKDRAKDLIDAGFAQGVKKAQTASTRESKTTKQTRSK